MVLRAFVSCHCQLRPGILSAAWIFMALVIIPTVKAEEDIFKCDFEFDLCGTQQSGSDWVRKSGATSSMDAGPEGGYDESKYYFYPDNLKKLQVSEFATPDLSSTGVVCIQFAYTAHGTQVGKLIVYAQKGSQTATRKEIWQSPEVNVKNWILERLPYSVESGERIIWRAISGGTGEEMAVDSILIATGPCNETCKDSQWKEEKQIMSPGGIFWANLNTPDLCKDQCVMLPQCLAVDMMNEGSRVLCYHHIKTFSLREVIKVAGASQNTIITRCGTAGMEATPSPSPASGCQPVWTKRSYFYSLGGMVQPEVHSASACRDACLQERSCIAVDVQWSGNVLDDSLICRLHTDRTKLLVPLLMSNTEQWELVDRCSMVDVEKSRGFIHKPLADNGCLRQWEERQNTHYVGGTYFTAPNTTILNPRTCLAECHSDPKCIAVDINFGRSPMECWLFASIADRSKFYSAANIRHYYLTKRCASEKVEALPARKEEEDGSGSDDGEGSGGLSQPDPDPPEILKPQKPEVCKTLNWERQPDFYSLGGTKSTSSSMEHCLASCVNDAKCQGIDFHAEEGCITHQEAADFYYALSGVGWIQYQLISDCAKIPTKERPGKAKIKSECTKGVVQKEFLRAPGAVFYAKVSSTWQCLDLCIHDKKCMAAEIRKVDRGLSCYYHYKNINFDVLVSSNDAVLYVLGKQCIRLRDSDLALTPKKTPVTLIPIVDLDKDDTFIEAEATFCEDVTCYLVMKASLTWKEAQTECEMKHGKLVSIKSAKTQNIIEKYLKIHKITDMMWIGASIINEIAFTNQSVSLWRVVQGTGNCESGYPLSQELLRRAVMSQGCFMEAKDKNEKEFNYTATVPPRNLTPSSCLEACRKERYDYAGVQDGSVCTCGNSFGMYGPASDCVEPCHGDYKQYCGGLGAHAVFKAAATVRDFSMWNYNEPKNTSTGHWCGAIDMFELDTDKRLASRPCNEDQKFLCQMKYDACKTEPNYKTMSWGLCIYFGKDEVTWHQARTQCLDLGGDLLIVASESQRKEIQEAVQVMFPSMSKRYIWIGLYSRIYYWDDLFGGSELCYTKFSQGEPEFEKNCLYLDPKKNFEWFSGLCEDERHDFICEIDTSKGELALILPSRPPFRENARVPNEGQRRPSGPRPQPHRVAASTDDEDYDESGGGGGGTPLSALEIALIAAIGVVAVALVVGGTMYGVSKQRNRANQQDRDTEMRQPPLSGSPAEPAQSESRTRTASRQASSLSASQRQGDTQSAGSPSLKQSRESQSVKFEGAPGSGVDSTSGGAPLSGSASSAGASGGGSGGSTKGSTKGD